MQEYDKGSGITVIKIKDSKDFFIIVEAKCGCILLGKEQLLKYADRESFKKSYSRNKVLVTLSECSREYAYHHLGIKDANGISIEHVSWKEIYKFTKASYPNAPNNEKNLLRELQAYLRELMAMQNQTSNEVYVITTNMHDGIVEMSDIEWEGPHFIYMLDQAIISSKEIKTGNIFRNGRVWYHLDALLTCDTISEARDLTKRREE